MSDDAETRASLTAEIETLRRRTAELELELSRKREVAAALRESEARYRAIIEDQTELICRFRGDGTLTFVNGAYCRYFGKTQEELVGRTFAPLIPEEDQRLVAKQFGKLGPQNPVVEYEHRVVRPDGAIRWQRWTDRVLLDEAGQIVDYQAVGSDITERKEAEEEVRRLNAELEQRVAEKTDALRVVIRELSTPLIPLADGVIAMPLIGMMDSARASAALETLLQGVVDHRAATVVLDITGVSVVDTLVADALMRAAQAVKLLGAEVVLTGIQPRIAQTLVALGVDMSGVITLRSLKEGIAFAMRRCRAKGPGGQPD